MNTVLDYLAIDVTTMYENNIKLHFFEYVERLATVGHLSLNTSIASKK